MIRKLNQYAVGDYFLNGVRIIEETVHRGPPYETCSAVQATKSLQNSCAAKLQLFSSILEAKQQVNSSCSGMQKCCAAFEALGSSFAAQLPTFKCFQVASCSINATISAAVDLTFLSTNNMIESPDKALLATDYSFYNAKTVTVLYL